MKRYHQGTNIADFDAVRLAIASSKDILEWSYGEITKPETINYRTQKPERDGLFCEKIFGPVKDINPNDAKYKGLRARDMAVDKNGEIVTRAIVRRERMGHITLAAPVAHIWFLRGTPSATGLVLNMTVKNLERIAYFASYVVLKVNAEARDQYRADKEAEYNAATEAIKARYEQEAAAEGADIKKLAELQTKELEEISKEFEALKDQIDSLEKLNLLNEVEYRNLNDDLQDMIEVGMGGSALNSMLSEVDLVELIKELAIEAEDTKGQRRKKIMKRLRMLESMQRAGIEPTSLCLTVLPVIPPDLRPMVQLTGGRFATSDMNDLYRRVINRNNRLKKLIELNAPEVIRRNEQRMLQEAVDALIDNGNARSGRAVSATGGSRRRLKSLSDMLRGKQGRFRQNLLGKRVDYSGRSVIVAGPELKMDQCGLPKMMALELFKPFVIGNLIANEHAHNIKSATRLIELGETVVWDALDMVIKGKYVLLNRAPSLHRLSIQAFQPVLIEGKAIQLHPLVCKGFNADFDGDQMAVHLPLSVAAQKEAKDLMRPSVNLLKPADGSPILHIEQDIVLGCYYMTYAKEDTSTSKLGYSSIAEAVMAHDADVITLQTPIRLPIKGETRNTTVGRALFNEVFPEEFPYLDEPMTKKKLQQAMGQVFAQFGSQITAEVADALKRLGFEYATRAAISLGMDDFSHLNGIEKQLSEGEEKAATISQQYNEGFITEEERYRLTVETWMSTDAKILESLQQQFTKDDTAMSIAVLSGARGSIGQVKQVTASIGIMSDATGRAMELPIRKNYKDGLSPIEYFVSTRGARKGLIDTALKTADSGYLTRRLVDVAQDVFTITTDEDNDHGFDMFRSDALELGMGLGQRVLGRFIAEDVVVGKEKIAKKKDLVTKEIAEAIDKNEVECVKIFSPLSSQAVRGISSFAYGIDMASSKVVAEYTPIGVIAAQSIGEPGTQLTLRTFHAGGVAGEDITTGLPRVEELFEARTPKGQAFIADIAGTVTQWEEGEHYVVQITADKIAPIELSLDDRAASVKSGHDVQIGDVIASNEEGANPLITPMAGRVEFSKGFAIITPKDQAVLRYEIPGYKQLVVKDGDLIEAGDRITGGSINLHDLMRLKGVETTQRYIINEISKIFTSQGQNIADKHLEIIVRQMFSRVSVEESGDSEFVTGDVVSKAAMVDANAKLAADGKQPAIFSQLLLGITKVSTWSDSFLSAASFQDTTRVLISAATSGKVDHLYGLKENVILGRKIPVGTGAVTEETASVDEDNEI